VNSPKGLGVLRRLANLDELQTKARDGNARLLHAERVGQGCVLASPALERVALPTVDDKGRRAPALRFGDPRVMALAGALSILLTSVVGFTNRSLRAQVSALLGTGYTANQMSYNLARLRNNGLIHRLEHTNTYVLTDDGQRVAIFYTKVHDRAATPLARRQHQTSGTTARRGPGNDQQVRRRLHPDRPPQSRVKLIQDARFSAKDT
jgi:hypothetical protein